MVPKSRLRDGRLAFGVRLTIFALSTPLFVSGLLVSGLDAAAATPRAEWRRPTAISFYTTVDTRRLGKPEFRLMSRSGLSVESLLLNASPGGNDREWALEVPVLSTSKLATLIKKDLNIELRDADRLVADEPPLDSTGVRLTGILDEFANLTDALGCRLSASRLKFTCRLWAPAARNVDLLIYDQGDQSSAAPSQRLAMTQSATQLNGTWEVDIVGNANPIGKYYLFSVTHFWPDSLKEENHLTTDPWSISLSANSAKSQFIDLNASALQPVGWSNLKPNRTPGQPVIYEVHLRDVTALEPDANNQGAYRGVSNPATAFHQHLKRLAAAGVTHLHVLPAYDFGSVSELRKDWILSTVPSGLTKDSPLPQQLIDKNRTVDSYNWGYDPVHLMVPEGSYSSNPNGPDRVREFRDMVSFLNSIKVGLVLDVVFNHMYQSGRALFSTFDKIAPYYFFRSTPSGQIEESSCCPDTASERVMAERWIVDSIVHWATQYKVSGFRFDLMSFHTKSNLRKIRSRLDQLTLPRDGVDGKTIILYGEGWTFGSLVARAPHEAMTQDNAFGLGIGTFNDRFRDAIRGGTPHSSEKSDQGWATGLFNDFNQEPANQNTPIAPADQRLKLAHLTDVIKAGLAGNLADFRFIDHFGQLVSAGEIRFRNQRLGYAAATNETVNYVSAHDGYSLWDAVNAKLPFYTPGRTPASATIEERAAVQRLMLGTVLLSQGIVFIEGGSEILRSKSGDQDSFDSSDWFNAIDFRLNTDRWGQGLPPAWKNGGDVSFWSPRLTSISSPQRKDREETLSFVESLLRLRARSSHFNMLSLSDVQKRLRFYPEKELGNPGLIIASIDGAQKTAESNLLIVFNPAPNRVDFETPFVGAPHKVVPELGGASKPVRLQSLSVGARSISVWEVF